MTRILPAVAVLLALAGCGADASDAKDAYQSPDVDHDNTDIWWPRSHEESAPWYANEAEPCDAAGVCVEPLVCYADLYCAQPCDPEGPPPGRCEVGFCHQGACTVLCGSEERGPCPGEADGRGHCGQTLWTGNTRFCFAGPPPG